MRCRAAVSVFVSTMVLLALQPALAAACNEPEIGATPTAGPGDTVHYTVSNLQPGAEYTISLQRFGLVAQGTSESEHFSGTFVMPDFGATADVTLELTATHVVVHSHDPYHKAPEPDSFTIHFAAPAAEATAPATVAQEAGTRHVDAAPAAAAVPQESAPSDGARGARPAQRTQGRHGAATSTATRATPTRTARTTTATIAAPSVVARAIARPSARPADPAPHRAVTVARAYQPPFSDAATRVSAKPAAATEGGSAPDEIPPVLVVLFGALLAHIGWMLARLRRAVPAPLVMVAQSPSDDIERELQELLAEEERRRLTTSV